jgi:hypothetical protein
MTLEDADAAEDDGEPDDGTRIDRETGLPIGPGWGKPPPPQILDKLPLLDEPDLN